MSAADDARQIIDSIVGENLRPADLERSTVEFKVWPLSREGRPIRKKISEMACDASVCFANSDGGLIVFGIDDKLTGRSALKGCPNAGVIDLTKIIYETTHPPITAEVCPFSHFGLDFIGVRIVKSPKTHATHDGRKLRRVGDQCMTVFPEDDVVIEVSKGGDFSSKFIEGVYDEVIDPREVALLRTCAKQQSAAKYGQLSDDDFLMALGLAARDQTGRIRLNIAGLLLVGRKDVLERTLPQAEIALISYRTSTQLDREEFIKLPLLSALNRVTALVEPYNTKLTLSTGLFEISIPRLPDEVLREALLNALAHRDYSVDGTVYVRLFQDSTEISNPGGFLDGINPDNILHHDPRPRNRVLAEALQKIGLVNRAGLGVDRMFQVLLENGKEPPMYRAKANSVLLRIVHDVNKSFARFVSAANRDGVTYTLDEIIILKYLCRQADIDTGTAASICQRTDTEAREVLNGMARRTLLEKRGRKKGQRFSMAKRVCDQLGEGVEYSRDRGIDEIRYPEMVVSYLKSNGRICNRECQQLCGIDRGHAIRLLRGMRRDGRITLVGGGRGAHYVLPK